MRFLLIIALSSALICNVKKAFGQQDSKVESSIVMTQKVLDQLLQTNDTAQIVAQSKKLARDLLEKGYYARASKIVERCMQYNFVQRHPDHYAQFLMLRASVYKMDDDSGNAFESMLKAKSIFEKNEMWKDLAICNAQIGENYRSFGLHEKAKQALKEAKNIYSSYQLEDTSTLIYIYNRLAAVYNESTEDTSSTLFYSRKAIKLASAINDLNSLAVSYNEMGFTYKNKHEYEKAIRYYKKAEDAWSAIGSKWNIANVMQNRAMAYQSEDFLSTRAFKLYHDVISYVKEQELNFTLERPYLYLLELSLKQKDTGKAFIYMTNYHDEIITKQNRIFDLNIRNLSEKYENKKAKNELKKVTSNLDKVEKEFQTKDQESKRKTLYISVLISSLAIIVLLILVLRKANKKLAKRNQEKDAMIQEIHHRVKNNLQFISSLMNMQMNTSQNNQEQDSLGDASRRIKAMALVHEMLYNHDNLQKINIRDYLIELADTLKELVNNNNQSIKFKLDIEAHTFDVSSSIALGMISSELISNSIKYAFDTIQNPTISIELKQIGDNEFYYTLMDNGKGFKQKKDSKKTLGLRLIDIFSRQLKGNYALTSQKGCRYELSFKIK